MTTLPDPRPAVAPDDTGVTRLHGARCTSCGHPLLVHPPRCARCLGPLAPARFGPAGTVWSSTVVRIGVPGRTPPYTLAYVDLVDGPRILAHVAGHTERVAVGTAVRLVPSSREGDLVVEVVA